MTGLKYSYKRIALQKRERAGVKQSEQPVKLLDERTLVQSLDRTSLATMTESPFVFDL